MPPPDRLTALDLSFFDLETPEAPLHVGWTIRFEGRPPSLAALRRHIDRRLDRLPRFRRRVMHPALGLGDAHWADDPGFDIARHVHALRLPAPGGPAELRLLAGAVLSQPLDHARPLWRIYLVDGLPSGFAIVGQAHHALVDGAAAIQVAMLLFDAEPAPAAARTQPEWRPTAPPGGAAVAAAAATARAGGAARRANGLLRALGTVRPDALREAADAISAISAPAPHTALDRTSGPGRLVAYADVSLDAVRETGRRHGATVNDVLLAASSLALGRALRRRGELPTALKAMVPVNIRGGESAAGLGNRISFMTVDLPVAEPDAVRALRVVRARTRARKAAGAAGPLQALAEAADLLPAGPRRMLTRATSRATPFNVVVSNVPGPPVPLYLLGRRVASMHAAVPILHGHAIAICGLSYCERLHIGVYADAGVVPDAVDIARDIEAAFDALRLTPAAAPPPWRARARARRDQRAASR